MAAIAGLLYGRQSSTSAVVTGTTFADVPLEDAAGSSTTVVPANGTEYLVLPFGNMVTDNNTVGAELRCMFGGTVYARAASTMRFSSFNTANEARGSALCSAFTVTGNGTDALTIQNAAQGAGVPANANGCDLVAIPTSALLDYASQESANGEAAVTTPGSGAGWVDLGTDLTFTPSSSGDYIILASVEMFGDGTDTGADVFASRFQFGVDGSISVVQNPTRHERESGASECLHSYCWTIVRTLTGGTTYRANLQGEGTLGNGNLPARRVRFFAFRASSFNTVITASSTTGINSAGGGGVVDDLPGATLAIPDPGEADIIHLFRGQTEAQVTQFVAVQLNRDSGAALHPHNGTFRGNDNNGTGVADDHTFVHVQSSEVLPSGSTYSVQVQAAYFGAGAFTFGRNAGNTADVPSEFVAIALQAPAGGSDLAVAADIQAEATLDPGVTIGVPVSADVQAEAQVDVTVTLSGATLEVAVDIGVGSVGFVDVDSPINALTFDVQAEAVLEVTVDNGSVPLAVTANIQAEATLDPGVTLTVPVAADVQAEAQVEPGVALSLLVSADVQAEAIVVLVVGGLVVATVTGSVVAVNTTRPYRTESRGRMGQPWYVNPEDEGQTLRERIVYPELVEHGKTTEARAPADLSSVQVVGLEYWSGSAWVAIAGSGSVESVSDDGQTWWELSFTPSAGALAAVVAALGRRGSIPRRWSLDLTGGGDLHVPSTGYDVLYANELPS